MTLESPPFCPHCEEPLSPNVGYCPRCGKDVLTRPEPPAPAPVPEPILFQEAVDEAPDAVGTDPAETSRWRRTAVIAVSAVAALAVAGTAWGVLRGDTDEDYWTTRLAQPAGVTARPELAWTWTGESAVQMVVSAGSTTYVATTEAVHALDPEGREDWSTDLSGAAYLMAPAGADYLLVLGFQSGEVTALDPHDGAELWTRPGDDVDDAGDRVVLLADGTAHVIDARSGRERWSTAAATGVATGPDAVYVVDDDRLRRLDLDDGDEVWSAPVDDASSSSGFNALTVADGFVVTAGTHEARAFDSDSGAPRWTADIDVAAEAYGPPVGQASRSTVFVWGEEPRRAVIYDARGRIGSVPGDDPSGFYVLAVHGAGGDFLVTMDGTVYDDDLDEVGTSHPHLSAVSGDGVYDLTSDTVSFFAFDATEPAWRLDLAHADPRYLEAGDGTVVVVSDDTVSLYR